MNILILSWRGPRHPEAGGAEISTIEHAKVWQKNGHKVYWFTSDFSGSEREDVYQGIKIIRKGSQILSVHISAFFWYLFSSHPKFDLVVDQFHGIPFFTPLFVRTKKMAFIHEVTKEVWFMNRLPKPINLVVGILGWLAEPVIFKLIYKNIFFMTVSDSTRDDLIKFGINNGKVKVINNGLSKARFKAKRKEKNITILYLGALAKDKGIEEALEVFKILKSNNPSWQFWIVGKGEKNYVEKIERIEYINYFGYVSDKKKFTLLSCAHVLVNPSVREGWGMVNIEANRVGTPVVGYNVPGMRDSVIHNKTGILVSPHNVELMAEVIESLVSNQEKYVRISKQAYRRSRKYTWKKATAVSLKLIELL